jgi:hypothetical protein
LMTLLSPIVQKANSELGIGKIVTRSRLVC